MGGGKILNYKADSFCRGGEATISEPLPLAAPAPHGHVIYFSRSRVVDFQ
jgi:hypothetical protein